MKKKTTKPTLTPQQKRIRKLFDTHVKEMRDFIGLNEWSITTCVADGLYMDNEPNTTMVCNVQVDYLRARITSFDPAHHCTDEELEEILMHELCHIITQPMYKAAKDNASPQEDTHLQRLNEQETERIARIAIKSYRACQ